MLSRRLGAHQRPNCSFLFALTAPSSIIFCSRSVSLVTKSLLSFSLVITWWRLAGRRGGTRKEAHYIDRQSRFWVPLLYVTTMLLFGIGISMEDDYRGRSRIEGLDLDQENLAANKHFQSLNVTSEKYKSTFAPMREALDGIHFTLLPAAKARRDASAIVTGGDAIRGPGRKQQQAAHCAIAGRTLMISMTNEPDCEKIVTRR